MGLIYPHLKQFDTPIDIDFAPMYILYPYIVLMSNKLRVKYAAFSGRADQVNIKHLLLYDNLLNSLPSINIANNLDEARRIFARYIAMIDIIPTSRNRLTPLLHDTLDFSSNYEGFVMPAMLELMFTIVLQQYRGIENIRPMHLDDSRLFEYMLPLYLYSRVLNYCI